MLVGDPGLLLRSELLLELSLIDGLAELARCKLLGLEDLIGISDEFGHLDFDLGAVNIEGLSLLRSSSASMIFNLTVDIVELFVDEGLGKIVCFDDLANGAVLEHVHLLGTADATSEREDTTLARVGVRRRVGDAKRAVDAVTVLERRVLSTHVFIMARVAHVVRSEAAEERNGTAVHALPVDLDATMRLAGGLSGTDLLEEAILAEEVFFLGLALLSVGHLLLAVDETTEVGLLATVALIEGCAVVGELLGIVVVGITDSGETLIMENPLIFSVLKSLLLNMLFEGNERAELAGNGLGDTSDVDLRLAAGAAHEGESDSECSPLVLEELNDAICVEDMAAGKLGASFSAELGGVADCAELVLIDTLEVSCSLSAVNIQAGKAAALLGDTFAGVATLFMSLFAEGDCRLFFNHVLVARVDLNELSFVLEGWKLERVAGGSIRGASLESWNPSLEDWHLDNIERSVSHKF